VSGNTAEKLGFRTSYSNLFRDLRLVLVIFLGILLRIILLVYGVDYEGDAEIYARRGREVLEGFIPYKDYVETKPPLWIASVVAWFYITTYKSFNSIKSMLIIADIFFLIGALYLIHKGINREKYDPLIFLILIALNPMIIVNSAYYGRYDIIPAAFAFSAFFFLRYKKEKVSALMLGIATMYKYLAAVFLPPLLISIKTNVKRIEYILIFSSLCLLILIPVYFIASIDRFIEDTYYYFSERGARGLGLWKLASRLEIINTSTSSIPFIVQAICLVIVTIFMVSKKSSFINEEVWIEFFIIVFFVTYLLSNKIILMQYFIFYLPFLAFITSRNEINMTTKKLVYILNFITFILIILKREYIDNTFFLTLGIIGVYLTTIIPLMLIYKLLIKTKI